MIRYPEPLSPGDLIAVTAPSSGVAAPHFPRLDLVLSHLRMLGYQVIEGGCLRSSSKSASGPARDRADELQRFLLDPQIKAVIPPWGGELASEVLDYIDFERLRVAEPTWMLGYSDTSTLLVPLTLIAGWATAHGTNLMELAPTQTDPLTTSALSVLGSPLRVPFRQASSSKFQKVWRDFAIEVDAPFDLTEVTEWKRLDGSRAPVKLEGRLIGGCLDTLVTLAGTRYGDIPGFVDRYGQHGTVLYLENAEMSPTALVRSLLHLRRLGWFDGIAGLLIGRNAGPEPAEQSQLSYVEALTSVLAQLDCPVIYDVDIGHVPPQLTLVNGAIARIEVSNGGGTIEQLSDANGDTY